jgi:hypothetical protein
MAYQGKTRRIRVAAGLTAVLAAASTVAAYAGDTGSLLTPILAPAPVAAFATPAGGYAAFATGTVLHAGLVGQAAGLDFVSSTAAATSAPSTSPVSSELGRVALPALPAKGSYGQGVGLGLAVGLVPGLSAGLFGNASAVAPPSTAPVEQDAAPISLPPLVSLTPFRGQAQALSSAAACVLGSNLAFGRAEAANLSLAGQSPLSVGAPAGAGAASGQPLASSESTTLVVAGSEAGRLGLLSETTQTLAPVTLLAGTGSQFTVNLLGKWALRVTADGRTGSVSFGPQVTAADQSVLEVSNAAGAVVAPATAAQVQGAGDGGLHIPVAGAEIVIGERPRARGRVTPAEASGTSADAAVDLVRVRLLGQDVRLGHMEAAVAVPAAGVNCPGLQVSVTPAVATAAPGDTFGATVTVRNPNEGTANDVAIATRFAADPGIDARPGAVSLNGKQFGFGIEGLRLTTPLGPGQAVAIPMAVRVVGASRPGRIRLGASASGRYGDGALAVPTAGAVDVDGPSVSAAAAPGTQNSAGTPAPVTAGAAAPAGSGGRRPARASAGTTGAAGPAASAAPAAPAPTVSAPPPAPAVEPAAPQPPVPQPAAAPAPAPPAPPVAEHAAAPKFRAKGTSTDRRRWAWGAAAAVFLMAIAGAGVARLTAGARR